MEEEAISKYKNNKISYALFFNMQAILGINSISDMFVFIQEFLMNFSEKNGILLCGRETIKFVCFKLSIMALGPGH